MPTPVLTSIIDAAIPQQNFELIRDRIGGILLAEFMNQKINFSLDEKLCPKTVDIGRFITADESEFPVMIVSFDKGKYGEDGKDYSGDKKGTYVYNIDILTGSASTLQEGGDQLATAELHRMIGIASAILDDTRYATLGFDPKVTWIGNVHVEAIYSNLPNSTDNATDYIHGRVVVHVSASETTSLPSTVAGTLGGTTVHLYQSDKFFFWGVPATP